MISYSPIIHSITYKGYRIGVLRLDLIHPEISGNKWFKLRYNLEQAKKENKDTIITFGGAFSNHIAATAVACKLEDLKSIGIIRGEETSANNPTLSLAKQNGMELLFVSRDEYSQKTDGGYLQRLRYMYPEAFVVPEGGDNRLGQKGCEEILTEEMSGYATIFCAYGTGTTFKGLTKSLLPSQQLIAVNVLKYEARVSEPQTSILNEYHFGGYAKHTDVLLDFKSWFENEYQISLDYVYTSKLFFAVFDLINQNKFNKEEKILIIHSGGLQGNKGYEERYNLKPNRQVNDAQG
ncbi:MAG: 1-aminocyclopropane-carboxylate deaminase [Bacteroidetes bacterium]|jgi:1-aminocyclopropane-1-carboxylate deaminase|nr:1-aminocyclopropane-carboxylate deaminase [Bacteroidota bacterium]MDF2452239.1 1-aminocyclopropane-carboxylate deaminase [Bacteroidota bacterium]